MCWRWSRSGYHLRKLRLTLRLFFYISYKGTSYHGWQIQPTANTVQHEINNALELLFQTPIETLGSGRTDAGVHAKMQVFHADVNNRYKLDDLKNRLNGILPDDIVVNNILTVNSEAHARFDAIQRGYEYHVSFNKTPFSKNEYYYLTKKPDANIIQQGCDHMIGVHDFTSFSKIKTEVNNFNCTVFSAKWEQNDEHAVFSISANRFLRGMVRATVGTLLELGSGKISLADFKKILHDKNRGSAGQSVPPQGLYLCDVRYPDTIFL